MCYNNNNNKNSYILGGAMSDNRLNRIIRLTKEIEENQVHLKKGDPFYFDALDNILTLLTTLQAESFTILREGLQELEG